LFLSNTSCSNSLSDDSNEPGGFECLPGETSADKVVQGDEYGLSLSVAKIEETDELSIIIEIGFERGNLLLSGTNYFWAHP
jgi:hypothetical protein